MSAAPSHPYAGMWVTSDGRTSGRPDALREDMGQVLIEQDSVWELRVQLCTDLEKMPVEDTSVV